MTQERGFFYRWKTIEEVLLVYTIIHIGIDSKIAHPERCHILEEMRALTWIYMVIGQTSFHDDTGSRDMRPLDRNTQP